MNNLLKELISQYVNNLDDKKLSYGIKELRPKDADFTDELFDSFATEGRSQIYCMLLLWTGPDNVRRILERRVKSEADESCKELVELMLRSAKDW